MAKKRTTMLPITAPMIAPVRGLFDPEYNEGTAVPTAVSGTIVDGVEVVFESPSKGPAKAYMNKNVYFWTC